MDKDRLEVGQPDRIETVCLSKWASDGLGPSSVRSWLGIRSRAELKIRLTREILINQDKVKNNVDIDRLTFD